jgi:cobalt-zinc-cadmium efflux system membrane fusion protein
LQALAQADLKAQIVERMRPLAGSGVSGADLQEAEAALRAAQIRLLSAQQALVNLGLPVRAEEIKQLSTAEIADRMQFLGLPESIRKGFDPRTTTGNLLPVVAPQEGVVVAREAVAGEVVDAARVLFIVADARQMWLTLNVRLEDAKSLALGQPVLFRPDGGREEARGQVTWISTEVDERSRTVQVRADLANPAGRLRAFTFGTGKIVLREEKQVVVVPSEALHWEGCCHVVFVRDKDFLTEGAPKVFHVRKVRPGAKDDQHTEIIAGVLPGEIVAAAGSGVLRGELLKNNLGAG